MNGQPSLHGGPGPGSGPAFDRDRELGEQRRRAIEQDEMGVREREQLDKQQREPYPSAGAPHHSSASALPIHQPVASRIPGAISPGGLLANHGSSSSHMLGNSQGPVSFGGPLHAADSSRPAQHIGPQNGANPQHQMFAPIPHSSVPPNSSVSATSGGPSAVFGGPLQQQEPGRPMQQIPFSGGLGANPPIPAAGQGTGAIAQGQQPILNVSTLLIPVWPERIGNECSAFAMLLDGLSQWTGQVQYIA